MAYFETRFLFHPAHRVNEALLKDMLARLPAVRT
jgi:hypothetical protein